MCTPKPPKVSPNDPNAKPKDPAIIRNPYLDNATDFARSRMGRSQLRVDPGTPRGVRIPLPGSATRPGSGEFGQGRRSVANDGNIGSVILGQLGIR